MTTLSPSLSPEVPARHRLIDPKTGAPVPDAELEAIVAAVGTARDQALRLADLGAQVAADSSRTPADAARVMADAAPRIAGRGADALDKALERARAAVERLERQLAAPTSAVGMAYEAEHRAVLRNLQPEARRAAINEAIASGDDALTGAVLRGGALLSGLSAAELESFRVRWAVKALPAEAGRHRRLSAAMRDAEAAGAALVRIAKAHVQAPALEALKARTLADAALAKAAE